MVKWACNRLGERMNRLKKYHRPNSITDALALLNRRGVATAVVAGGTHLIAREHDDLDEVVDLQAVGLDSVTHRADSVKLGATVRLQALVDDPAMPPLLRDMALLEAPNTIRNAATIGGTIASAAADSELLAALLVLDASVTLQDAAGERVVPLVAYGEDSAESPHIITAVTVEKGRATAHARVARTPKDRPIVAAVAARTQSGELRLALCGVAATVILIDPAALDALTPPDDFRGSSAYRHQMAHVLTQRALSQLPINNL
jgi:probable selenate reductase FAD-binding subunit